MPGVHRALSRCLSPGRKPAPLCARGRKPRCCPPGRPRPSSACSSGAAAVRPQPGGIAHLPLVRLSEFPCADQPRGRFPGKNPEAARWRRKHAEASVQIWGSEEGLLNRGRAPSPPGHWPGHGWAGGSVPGNSLEGAARRGRWATSSPHPGIRAASRTRASAPGPPWAPARCALGQ